MQQHALTSQSICSDMSTTSHMQQKRGEKKKHSELWEESDKYEKNNGAGAKIL